MRSALAQAADTELADLPLWRVGRTPYVCLVSRVIHGEISADRDKARLAGRGELLQVTVAVNRCADTEA